MASTINSGSKGFTLERLQNPLAHTFSTPTKQIHDGEQLTFFFSSTAYRQLITWLLQLDRSMFPTKDANGKIQECRLDSPPNYSQSVQNLRNLLSDLTNLIEKAPPDTGPRRFGNVAFKTWFKLVEDSVDAMLQTHLVDVFSSFNDDQKTSLQKELSFYLIASLGSSQRLDYGTGHELSFLAFLGCPMEAGCVRRWGRECHCHRYHSAVSPVYPNLILIILY